MAEVSTQMITCPGCGKEMKVDIWESVNMPYDSDQKESIMKNTFFNVVCEHCGVKNTISYKCEYNDIDKRYYIRLMPKVDGDVYKELQEYNERLKKDKALYFARSGFVQRMVCDSNELREKILIFDEGYDDRYIELMKLAYYKELRKTLPENSMVVGLYFDKHGECAYHWIVIFNDRAPLTADINMEMYEDLKLHMKERVEKATPEGLCRIHGGWAAGVMSGA